MNPPNLGSAGGNSPSRRGPWPSRELHLADPADAPGRYLRVNAAGIFDAEGVAFAPGSILLELGRVVEPLLLGIRTRDWTKVLAVGKPEDVARHPAVATGEESGELETLELPEAVVLPGMVNAHTHLDLTHIGPIDHDPVGGFSTFVDRIRAQRHPDGAELEASVKLGIERSLRGGVVAIGDIAGAPMGLPSLTPHRVLAESGVAGVSFLEFFAVGRGEQAGIDRMRGAIELWRTLGGTNEGRAARLGIQPHAPYSVMPPGYEVAIEEAVRGGVGLAELPLATHLAETLQEREFIERGTGRQREFLERIGVWTDDVLRQVGQGRRPIGHLLPLLRKRAFLCAHVNDATYREIEDLAEAGARVVYCPRASEYFGAESVFGPHRYRDMLRAGVPVALGTDSILNLGVPGGRENRAEAPGEVTLGTWEEMRLLRRRDGVDGKTLLAMGTTIGARVLGMEEGWVTLGVGSRPRGIVAVRGVWRNGMGLDEVMEKGGGVEPLLLVRNSYC